MPGIDPQFQQMVARFRQRAAERNINVDTPEAARFINDRYEDYLRNQQAQLSPSEEDITAQSISQLRGGTSLRDVIRNFPQADPTELANYNVSLYGPLQESEMLQRQMGIDPLELRGAGTGSEALDAYADQIQAGSLNISNVPTDIRTGVVLELNQRPFSSEETNTYKGLLTQIDELGNLLDDVKPWTTLNPFSPLSGRIDTVRRLLGMQIARLFEKGRMSDQDRIFYLGLLPTATDSVTRPKRAKAQLDQMKISLEAKFATSGDTSDSGEIDRLLDELGY